MRLLLHPRQISTLLVASCRKIAWLMQAQHNDYVQKMTLNATPAIQFQNVITLPSSSHPFTKAIYLAF